MVKLLPLPAPAVPPSELITKSGVWGSLYTAEQVQAYGQQCREAALEETAKVCDERANGENDAQYCADRIRSLKS